MALDDDRRLLAFDWLRGLAVLAMVQTHALVLLQPALRQGPLFSFLVLIDGVVAPAFLFCAGAALALVMGRAARRGNLRGQARRSLQRIGEVLAAASLVNFAWFPVLREPKWLARLDILHCIGLSLLALLPVLWALASRPRLARVATLALALVAFAVAPLTEGLTGLGSLLLNNHPGVLDAETGTVFPLVPWAGHVFLGASLGTTTAMMERRAELWRWWALLLALGLAAWALGPTLRGAYPPHPFSLTNPASSAHRAMLVLGLLALFLLVEARATSFAQTPVAAALALFGTSSLSAYVIHQMLLFQRHVGVFGHLFRDRASWWGYAALWLSLCATTAGLMLGWDRLRASLARVS